MGNWPTSAALFAQILERKDLTRRRQDRGHVAAGLRPVPAPRLRHGRAHLLVGALVLPRRSRREERLQTDFYLGLAKYHLGEIPHEHFRAMPLRLPEKQMAIDMEEKARLLLVAQRQYIETIKLGNPQWASASGYQIGSLYEEFYDAFIHAPIPPELLGEANQEKREVYYEELRKRIRILLEKALRTHEQNLLMLERLGRPERVAGQVEARLRQPPEDARPHLQVRVRRPVGARARGDAGAAHAPGSGRPRRRRRPPDRERKEKTRPARRPTGRSSRRAAAGLRPARDAQRAERARPCCVERSPARSSANSARMALDRAARSNYTFALCGRLGIPMPIGAATQTHQNHKTSLGNKRLETTTNALA